jgi:hypothetical protein
LISLFSLLVGFVRCVKLGRCTSKCMQGYKQNLTWNDVKNQIKTKIKGSQKQKNNNWSHIYKVKYNYKGAQGGKIDHLDMENGPKNLLPWMSHNKPIDIVKQQRTNFKLQVVESVQQGCKHSQQYILPKHVFKRLSSFQINWLCDFFQCHFMYSNRKWCVWIFIIVKGGGTNKYSKLSPCLKKCNFYYHYY